jgi:NADH-quinone oxidoreductase subunit I
MAPLRTTRRYDIDMTKCIYCGLCGRHARSMPSSGPNFEFAAETREELLLRQGQAAGKRRPLGTEIARRLELDAPYR